MSASLVGSEMCIRDRVRASVPSFGNGCEARVRLALLIWALQAVVLRSGCLLYTSDAADDM
eukprot:4979426-Alexandrium_andersonii.AAC.1